MTSRITHWARRLPAAAALALCAIASQAVHAADPVKIGFLVKQAEEPWFQDEWKHAEQAAKEKGFALVKIGVPNGEKMISAIDNLAAQKAQGFVICAPDVKLGAAVARAAKRNNLKVMSVDDRLVDGAGKPIAGIPHMGISATAIGTQVGQAIAAEIKARGWKPAEVGALRIAYDQLPTGRERTGGAVAVLKAAGVPAANIVDAPQTKTDTESAYNAANIALTKNPKIRHWVAFGLNDEAVMGAVRAAEGRGFKADSMIGVGIGGSRTALNEFAKPAPTGFFGTIMLSPRRHGYETSINMYEWIAHNKVPPADIQTSGTLVTRANLAKVRRETGI
ncbi:MULTISPECIES: arabinose ABC transporter substrate-binding protein [unclassified Massilia]|uniref:arabinose ABC transporter substrate-binding protein n=1 Tax=unclassified Massilia TaxID=2609279 RepID=UPI0017808ADD|nr:MULTISPECIES: arabinose ABC transporter substrate-binding protein [unclassified Massilia]MBD8531071.1 arabinose ABC transporter substrate-binding protein [Massilia sp. CFBP 13647]MBD8674771.1 arabinose ABC transporter substrate-binding protein [Massilia sp. CFBP 13721]